MKSFKELMEKEELTRSDYKLSPSGRKTHKYITMNSAVGEKEEDKEEDESKMKEVKEQAPVAPTLAKKYIKGTPENKAYKASKKPINGHPTNVKEETEEQAADRKKQLKKFKDLMTPGQCEVVTEALDTHEMAMAHKDKASKALETSDMKSFHHHMSNHHESMGQWHESKGRHSSADREYAKAEEHHEKSLKPDNSRTVGVKNESVICPTCDSDPCICDDSHGFVSEAAQGHTIEAHGIRGMKGTAWRKTFKNHEHLEKWADANDSVEVHATRDLEQAKKGNLSPAMKEEAEINEMFNMLAEAATSIDKGEYDYEGQMARTQLQTTMRNCEDLIDMLEDDDNMPEWVQSKITLAQDYITTVRDYLQSKEELGEQAPVAPSLGVHRVAVTTSEPDHPMVSKRKETTQRFVKVTTNSKERALEQGMKHFKKKGFKVHGAEHVGMMHEAYGKYRSPAWHADGGANDERHDLDAHYSKPKTAEHPHAVHINGKKWKSFGSQSHAQNVANKIKGATVHKEEVELDEAHKLGSAVEVIKGSGKGIKGHIGEIRHGAYIGAPKTYTVYHGEHDAIQVPKEHIRAMKEEVELQEVLDPSMGAGEYVKDFQKSKAPQFKNKSKEKRRMMGIAAYLQAKRSVSEELKGKQHKIDKNKNGKVDAHDFKLLRKEEEQMDEKISTAQMGHAGKTTIKHIDNPGVQLRMAAHDVKPGIKGYRDRIALLKAAQAQGKLKEDAEQIEEEIESIDEANHREFAQAGKMHPDMAKHMKTGNEMDFYHSKTGDKISGVVTKNDGKSIHVQANKGGKVGGGETHKFAVSKNLGGTMHEGTEMPMTYKQFMEALWPGSAEYKKKFPDTSRTTGAGARHDIKDTGRGVIATRRFSDNDTAAAPTKTAEPEVKRGRGRPAGSSGKSYKARTAEVAAAARAKAAATKAANKNK